MRRFDCISLGMLPAATLTVALLGSWTEDNFSLVGARGAGRLVLALWGGLAALYCLAYLRRIFALGGYEGRGGRLFLWLAAASLLAAALLPYEPDKSPAAAAVHVTLAFSSPFWLGAALLCFLSAAGKGQRGRRALAPAWLWLAAIAAVSLALLLIRGFVTSLLEVFLVCSLCLYLRWLEGRTAG